MLRLALSGSSAQYLTYNQRMPGDTTWTCLCGDISPTEVLDDCRQVTSTDAFLANADAFDAVILHQLSGSLTELVGGLLEAGKHVCLDGDLLRSSRIAGELQDMRSTGSACLSVGWPLRYGPSHQAVKQACDSGKLGSTGLLRIHSWRPLSPDAPEQVSRLAQLIDLAGWLTGETATTIYSVGSAADAYAQVHLGYPSQAMAMLDVADKLPSGGGYFSLSLIGEDGAAYADDHHNHQLAFLGAAARSLASHASPALTEQLAAFVESVRDGSPTASISRAVSTLRQAEAAIASLESHQALQHQEDGTYELASL